MAAYACRPAYAKTLAVLRRGPLVSPTSLYNWHRAEGGMDTVAGKELEAAAEIRARRNAALEWTVKILTTAESFVRESDPRSRR